jgi:hypothetical protein
MSLKVLLALIGFVVIIPMKRPWNIFAGMPLPDQKRIKSLVLMLLGMLCLLIGIAFLPLPPPFFGMVLIALGIPMLAAGSKRTRRFIQYMRLRYYRHDEKLEYLLCKLPGFVRRHGNKTRPQGLMRYLKMTGQAKGRFKE